MKILIADDHELFLTGLKLALSDLSPDVVIDLARDYRELMGFVFTGANYDLILTDLAMPGMPWEDALKQVKEKLPNTPIVILSAVHNPDIVRQAIDLGASGFIPKTASNRIIISAINLVLSGGVYIPPEMKSEENENLEAYALSQSGKTANIDSLPLTPRQKEVLALIGQGKSNKVIAYELGLSEGTVKLHVTAILKALDVHNRTGAVVAAAQLGLTHTKSEEE